MCVARRGCDDAHALARARSPNGGDIVAKGGAGRGRIGGEEWRGLECTAALRQVGDRLGAGGDGGAAVRANSSGRVVVAHW